MVVETIVAIALGVGEEGAASQKIELKPRSIPGVTGRVSFGELEVSEDRGREGGRRIGIGVLVLGAKAARPAPDALFVLQGGPGQAASDLASFYGEFLAGVRETRDVVLVDQRGTGSSHPLRYVPRSEELLAELGAIAPVAWARNARRTLGADADLAQYTTAAAMEDLDAVRGALGYERIDLYGTSYGTRCALHYARRYPARVRAMVLKNVAPIAMVYPVSGARDAQACFDRLLADVEADPAAKAAHPELRRQWSAVLDRLEKSPATSEARNPATGESETVVLDRTAIAKTLRHLLYSPQTQAQVPLLVEEASRGDFSRWVSLMVQMRKSFAESLCLGMSLSVIAAEDVPRIRRDVVESECAGTFLGTSFVDEIVAATAEWPRGAVPPGFFDAVRSDSPTLLVSGALDPVTPPRWADEARKGLRNSVHVVFPGAGHPAAGFTGLDALVARFVESGTVSGLDTSCTRDSRRPPFASEK
jgi:pimeloyl-ACP methyl ester carboxylesterase